MFIFPLLGIIANLLFCHDNCEGENSTIANFSICVFVFLPDNDRIEQPKHV
jgi:hypothetical protein